MPTRRISTLQGRAVAVAVYVGLNMGLVLYDFPFSQFDRDWEVWRSLAARMASGELYGGSSQLPYVLSPIAAPAMAVMGEAGPFASLALHVVVVLLLRNRLLIFLTLVSWGFWTDSMSGNTMTFSFVAGALSMAGSTPSSVVFFSLLCLGPRPVLLPLAAYLIVVRPGLRPIAAAVVIVNALVVAASGFSFEWIESLAGLGIPAWSVGPSHWLGWWWLWIGVPAAFGLLLSRRPGWAGLAASPYWVPHYFLMPLLDLVPGRAAQARGAIPRRDPSTRAA